MTPSSIFNYTLLTVACLLVLAGLILSFRALFADRSRGKPRCPHCWYDMSAATNLQCTECGRIARSPRRLHRTHRHWKRAILGVLLIIVGGATAAGQRVLEHGWIKAVPTWGYIVALPWLDPTKAAFTELESRVEEGSPFVWERGMLLTRGRNLLNAPLEAARTASIVRLLRSLEAGPAIIGEEYPDLVGAWLPEHERTTLAIALEPLLLHQDATVRMEATESLVALSHRSPAAMLLLFRHLQDWDLNVVHYIQSNTPFPVRNVYASYYEEAGSFPWAALAPFEKVVESATDPEQRNRLLSDLIRGARPGDHQVVGIVFAVLFHVREPGIVSQILACRDNESEYVRRAVVFAVRALPVNETSFDILRRGLQDSRDMALASMKSMGADARPLLPDLRPLLGEGSLDPYLLETWVTIGGDPYEALSVVRTTRKPEEVLIAIDALRMQDARLLSDVAPHLHAPDHNVRINAACAYLQLGGDARTGSEALFSVLDPSMVHFNVFNMLLPPQLTRAARRLDIVVLLRWMGDDSSLMGNTLMGIELLAAAGANAAEALPRLHELQGSSDPMIAPSARRAIKLIEWEIAHPEAAAAQRERE